jgi:hypothetical protein
MFTRYSFEVVSTPCVAVRNLPIGSDKGWVVVQLDAKTDTNNKIAALFFIESTVFIITPLLI